MFSSAGVDVGLLQQVVASNPLAFNQIISFACRTGDQQAVQCATQLLTFSMSTVSSSSSSLPNPHWQQYKAHISAVISCFKVNFVLYPETAAAAKAECELTGWWRVVGGRIAALFQRQSRFGGARGGARGVGGGVGCDYWLKGLKEVLVSGQLQLRLAPQQQQRDELSCCCGPPSSTIGVRGVSDAGRYQQAHLQLLLCSVRAVAATVQQLVVMESKGSRSSWGSRFRALLCVLAGNLAAALLALIQLANQLSSLWLSSGDCIIYGVFLAASYYSYPLGRLGECVTYGRMLWSCILRPAVNYKPLQQLLSQWAGYRPSVYKKCLQCALELSLLQYQNILLWQETAAGSTSSAAAAGTAAAGANSREGAALLQQLPKRLAKLPDKGLPAAAVEQMGSISRRWPDVLQYGTDPQQQQQPQHVFGTQQEQTQQQHLQHVCGTQEQQMQQQQLQQVIRTQEQQQQLLAALMQLFEAVLSQVPSPLGCNNPACVTLDGLSELDASKRL